MDKTVIDKLMEALEIQQKNMETMLKMVDTARGHNKSLKVLFCAVITLACAVLYLLIR